MSFRSVAAKNVVLRMVVVIYGAGHFYRAAPKDYLSNMGQDIGIVKMLEKDYPGRTFAVIPVGRVELPAGLTPPVRPDYRKFDRALKTQTRPVLAPLDRLPFRDFSAEEFMGNTIFNCRGPGDCRSIFQGSNLTFGQMADACVYVGGGRLAHIRR